MWPGAFAAGALCPFGWPHGVQQHDDTWQNYNSYQGVAWTHCRWGRTLLGPSDRMGVLETWDILCIAGQHVALSTQHRGAHACIDHTVAGSRAQAAMQLSQRRGLCCIFPSMYCCPSEEVGCRCERLMSVRGPKLGACTGHCGKAEHLPRVSSIGCANSSGRAAPPGLSAAVVHSSSM